MSVTLLFPANRLTSTMVKWSGELWGKCELRRAHVCCLSGREMQKGETAYRPIFTNKGTGRRVAPEMFSRRARSEAA